MEKRNLCKSGDSSMTVITAVVMEIKLPTIRTSLLLGTT